MNDRVVRALARVRVALVAAAALLLATAGEASAKIVRIEIVS